MELCAPMKQHVRMCTVGNQPESGSVVAGSSRLGFDAGLASGVGENHLGPSADFGAEVAEHERWQGDANSETESITGAGFIKG